MTFEEFTELLTRYGEGRVRAAEVAKIFRNERETYNLEDMTLPENGVDDAPLYPVSWTNVELAYGNDLISYEQLIELYEALT